MIKKSNIFKDEIETFECDCSSHILEIIVCRNIKNKEINDLNILIYDKYNPDSGRKYKKPKRIGDVIFMNKTDKKAITKFFDCIIKLSKEKITTYK